MNKLLITGQLLKEFGACSADRFEFEELYPDGIDIAPMWSESYQDRIDIWTTAIDHPFLRTVLGWAMENGIIPNSIPSFYMGEKDLTELDLSYAKIHHPIFTESILKHSDFTHANLEVGVFDEANLEGAILEYSYLRSAVFTNADLHRARFTCANLRHTTFFGAKNITPTGFRGAIISKSSIDSMNLPPDKRDILIKNVLIV